MKVVGKKILVQQAKTKEVSEGGIVLPGDSIQALPYGTIKQIGSGVIGADCSDARLGDVVLFDPMTAIPLAIKKDHVLIEAEDILAILEEGEC